MKHSLFIAPHPDDETLGCGGTILKEKAKGNKVSWLIVTNMDESVNFTAKRIASREKEIQEVAQKFRFNHVIRLNYFMGQLDQQPLGNIISDIGKVVKDLKPSCLYIPYPGDIHSDHDIVYKASVACSKWFRYSSINSIFIYEVRSETDFCIEPDRAGFRPNFYVSITEFLGKKIEILNLFEGEILEHPFPRSESSIRALATLRGAESGTNAAEAFMLLKHIDS